MDIVMSEPLSVNLESCESDFFNYESNILISSASLTIRLIFSEISTLPDNISLILPCAF